METIFIELQRPTDLLIAVLIKEKEAHNPYMLIKTQYGVDRLNEIEKSIEYVDLPLDDLPASLEDIYEWKDQFKDRFVRASIHYRHQKK